MKLLLILCVLSALGIFRVEGYEYGKSYRYEYHGHIYTGFSGLKPQRSGLTFDSDVIIRRFENYYVFQLESVRFDRFNSELSNIEDRQHDFHYLSSIRNHLSNHIKVYFNDGQIQYYETFPDEDLWSLNIKRGLLSLFNLNLDGEVKYHRQKRHHFDFRRIRESDCNFKVYEDGVGGECETSYCIRSEPHHETPFQNNVLNVTKVKNYHKCRKQPYRSYVAHKGYHCVHCDASETHPFHANSRYDYNIRGNRYRYVIERVVSEGEFLYSPYTTRGQTVYTRLNRTLKLVEKKEDHSSERHYNIRDATRHTSLSYQYEEIKPERKSFDMKNAHYLYDIYGYHVSLEEIRKLFYQLTEHQDKEINSEEYRDKNIPQKFAELVRAMATLNYRGIEDVYRYIVDDIREDDYFRHVKILELFINVLTATGTNPSLLMAKFLFKNKEIRPELVEYYLQTAPFHFKQLTESLLHEFYDLCEDSYIRGHQHLRSVCYLAFAGLVHQTCVVRNNVDQNSDKEQCTPEKASKYFNYLIPRWHVENDSDQIMYLKTARNFGLRETIEYVKPYISREHHQPLYFRISALWALSRVIQNHPDEVLELIVPLYFDTSEDYQIRIVSFILITKAKAPFYHLETIANSLYHEPSDQVKSFVYSTFYSLANSTHPCHRELSKKYAFFLKQLEALKCDFHVDLDHSFNFYTTGYEDEYDYGGMTHLSYIPSNSSYIPRAVFVRINDYFGGESHDTVSFGYNAFGLEKYLDKIFGPKGPFRDSSFFENFGHRSPRDINTVEKELKELYKTVNIETRDYEPIYGDFFVNHQGTRITFFHFNESFLERTFSSKHQNPSEIKFDHFQIDKHLLGTDRTYLIPTDLGLPLVFNAMQTLYLQYDNKNFNFEVKKKGIFPKEMKAHIDGHVIYDHETYATLEVVVPFEHISHGAGILRRSTISLPLNLNTSINFENSKITFKYAPVDSHNVYHLEFEPFTFENDYADHSSNYVKDRNPLYDEEHLNQDEHIYSNNYFGIGARTKIAYDNIWNDYGSWYDFLTKTDFRQKFYYYFGNPHFHPYNFDLFIEKPAEDKVDALEAVFKYDYYGLGDKEDKPLGSEHLEELEDYGITGSDRKWYTHVFSADLYGRGQHKRRVKTELTYSYSNDFLSHKYHLFFDRSPSESDHFQVCLSGILNFPNYDMMKFYALETENLYHSVNTTLNIYFGADCKSNKKITVKGILDRTEEQKIHESRREEPVTHERYNEYAYYYQKCQEERQYGHYYSTHCLYYLHLISELHNYKFEITYQNLPETFLNTTHKLASHFRHHHYNHMDRNAYAKNPEGQVRVEFNVSIHDPVADLRVFEPHETIHYTHIYVPYFHPVRTYPFFYYSNLQEYTKIYNYPYCLVQKDEVRTFDNVTYTLPPIDCYKVIAKDCSPTQYFLVLGKKITHSRYEKAVKIFFDKYKVEALPVSEESDLIVRVNGKRVKVIENEPYYHYVQDGERQALLFLVSYNGLYYSFHSHAYGLSVEYDGKAISVQVSPLQRGKQCGLCGDYNGDQLDEFRGPEGCIYHDHDDFGYSYAIPESGCTVPKYDSPCRVKSQECIQKHTRYIEIGSGSNRKACFSVTPIVRCAEGCQPKGTIRTTLHYHCLEALYGSTQHLKQETEYRVLDEIKNKSKDYSEEIEYPENCLPTEN